MQDLIAQFSIWSAIDVLVLSYIIYHILILVRGTKAAQMLTGILIVLITFMLSSVFPLTTLNWTMNKFFSSFIVIIIILFQDDIRVALSRIGKKSFISSNENISTGRILDELTRTAMALASTSTGALIVLERSIILSRYIDIGILIEGKISKEILLSIFHTSSPIHDGAVIIQRGKIAAAGCFLPLTRDEDVGANMGTRHRAAIGVSQETDAIVILVSEEDSSVSIAVEGSFLERLSAKDLRKNLQKYLVDEQEYAGTAIKSVPIQEKSQQTFLAKIFNRESNKK